MNVEDLLEDAHLVSSFGQRAGVLKTAALFEAIYRAELNKPTLSWASPEAATLQKELNAAIKDIAPVTLLNLKDGFDPFKLDKQRGRLLRLGLIGAAFLLLFLGAHYSVWQQDAGSVLQEIAKNKLDAKEAIIDRLLPTVAEFERTGVGLDVMKDASSLARSAFYQEVRQAQRLTQERVEDNNRFDIVTAKFFPGNYWLSGIDWRGPFTSAKAAVTDNEPPLSSTAQKLDPEEFLALPPVLVPYEKCLRVKADNLSAFNESISRFKDYMGIFLFGILVERDASLRQRVNCLVGVQDLEQEVNLWFNDQGQMKARLEMLNSWVLPALYGMLGAVIYHLRISLDPLRPDPEWVRVLLRTFLGGFAGVAIAWFWRPENSANNAFANIGLGTYALAFLVGFSIDAFFTLLDRLVVLMNQATASMGAQKTSDVK